MERWQDYNQPPKPLDLCLLCLGIEPIKLWPLTAISALATLQVIGLKA